METEPTVVGLLIAFLGGAAVGLERQWSGHAAGPRARFGGIRTFALLGGLAGLSGFLWGQVWTLSTVILAGAASIIVLGYRSASRTDVDATTEVAGLVVLAAGCLAGLGYLALSGGIFALTSLLLVEKSRLHALVRRIDDVGLRAGVRFGVMAVVILPVLPEGPFGPSPGIRPRELWAFVLLFTGLSFVGYLLRRVAGPRQGYLIAGLLGGLVSSTNVTVLFAQSSRVDAGGSAALAGGALAASAMLYPRILVAALVLAPTLALPLIRYLIAPFLIIALGAVWAVARSSERIAGEYNLKNPLQVWPALQMAAVFQVVLFVVSFVEKTWGQGGVLASGALLGVADVDALTLSMAQSVGIGVVPSQVAAMAIAIGTVANCGLKAALAALMGDRTFGLRVGSALAVSVAACVASLLVLS